MKKSAQHAQVIDVRTRLEQAKARIEQAEARTEQAETRTELAKTRTEQAEIRTEQAETRAEQAETILQHLLQKKIDLPPGNVRQLYDGLPLKRISHQDNPVEQLTPRQREILKLIAEGQNTKQIGGVLKVSPKTVEYHRMKLMDRLKVHDVPGLVRLAMKAGLVAPES